MYTVVYDEGLTWIKQTRNYGLRIENKTKSKEENNILLILKWTTDTELGGWPYSIYYWISYFY